MLLTLLPIYLTATIAHRIRHDGRGRSFTAFAGIKLIRFLLDLLPLIALVTIYENLREHTALIRPDFIDTFLYRLDLALFGVEPTIWIGRFPHPLLTESLAFAYSTYLVLPLSLAWILYLLSRHRAFHQLSMAVMICPGIGFFLYLLFPAEPQRFFLAGQSQPEHLTGAFGFYDALQARFDAVNPVRYRSSFPSLHVALSSLALFCAWSFRPLLPLGRLIAAACGMLTIALWIATIYLRHHWAVELRAGWGPAAASLAAARATVPLRIAS